MELEFVLGKSGSGKTTYCTDKILSFPIEKKIIYIVPEQFTLESEKLLTSRRKSLINIDVVSFRRLWYHISGEIGKITKEFLDDEGKSMIIRKLIADKELVFFGKAADKPGFIDSVSKIISEFCRFGISPENLSQSLASADETSENAASLKKLRELGDIYKTYNDFISEKYISSDQLPDYVARNIKNTTLFDGAEVFIDGFNSFTSQEYNILREIMTYSDRITISLCLDRPPDGYKEDSADPFNETKKAYIKLLGIFSELFPTDRKILHTVTDNSKNKKPSFDFLEKRFFDFPIPIFGKTDDIEVFSAVNKRAEVSAVCDKIAKLIEKGFRYRDIAIVICDGSYMHLLRSELKSRNIPDFTDRKVSVLSHPCAGFMLSLTDILAHGFRSADVFAFLKTGLTSISAEKISELEKYVTASGINGYRWELSFRDPYFEEIRKKITEITSPARDFIKPEKKYILSEINKRLFDAVEVSGFYTKYRELIENTEDAVLASRFRQAWEQIVTTFDKAEEFLGDSEVTLEDYRSIITSALSGKTIATIPLYQDNIIIGDIERSRYPAIRAMFVLGAKRGSLPTKFPDTNIIDDKERQLLRQRGIEIAAGTDEQLSLEYLKIYQILTKPSEKLFLSYPLGTSSGEKSECSEIAERLMTMFGTQPETIEEPAEIPENTTPFEPPDKIPEDMIGEIIGETLNLSSSKLDTYAKCPFSYLMTYILGLKRDKLFEIDPLDKGNILHGVMERFFKDAENAENMTEEEINRKISEIMPDVLYENLCAIMDEDKKIPENFRKLRYFCRRIESTADASVLANIKQLGRGSFVPTEFEVDFGGSSPNALPPVNIANNIILRGKIDRVDLYEDKDNVYIKITDYKSSTQTLDMAEIYNGLKLQLLLYLSAYTEELEGRRGGSKKIHPGGLMYFAFKNPKRNLNSPEDADSANAKFSDFSPTGFFSEEAKELFDSDDKPAFSYMNNMESLSEEDFKKLMSKAKEISAKTGSKIKKGLFPVKPYLYSGRSGCDYCPYSGICKIDIDRSRRNKIT